MNPKIWLSSSHLSGNEGKYFEKAFSSNLLATFGDNIIDFEERVKFRLDKSIEVAALSSGTAAVHLALVMLGVQRDDEVICQSFTFSASANPIVYLGAKPIFVDSEAQTWNMCPITLEKAILDRISRNKKPKAIIIVDLYGMPAKMDELIIIAQRYKIPLIEDAAEALGSSYKGKFCGTFGDFGVISFNGNKVITTSGGGVLVCKNKEQKEKIIHLSTQAKDHAPHYQHSEIGYNYRMSNINAGIGCAQFEVLEERIQQRRANHLFYSEIFKDTDGIELLSEPNSDFYSNHWLSAILIDEKLTKFTREDLRLMFLKDQIESRPLWKPMHLQPVFKNSPFYGENLCGKMFENGLCLPSGSNLTDSDRDRIYRVIQKFI